MLAHASTVGEILQDSEETDVLMQVGEQPSTLPLSQNHLVLRHILETIGPQSCPQVYNFHMHSVKSDGKLQPAEIMEQAIAVGLNGLAITDHHTTAGYEEAQNWLNHWRSHSRDSQQKAPILWTGVEINANLLNTDVHILAYGFDPQADSLQPYLQQQTTTGEDYQAASVINAIHQAGGLAVLAHPARYRQPAAQLIPEAARLGIDGAEVYYNYKATNPWISTPKITEEIEQLSQTYQLLKTCGTDTHGFNILLRR